MVHKHRRDFMLQGNEEFLQNTGRKTKMWDHFRDFMYAEG
jgi:hypothetical protein